MNTTARIIAMSINIGSIAALTTIAIRQSNKITDLTVRNQKLGAIGLATTTILKNAVRRMSEEDALALIQDIDLEMSYHAPFPKQ